MRRCAFLTLAERGDFVIDDERAYQPLAELGWQVEAVPWSHAGTRWGDYELVVIRSTWDYQSDPVAFLAALAEIEASGAILANPRDVVRWNLRKTYLKELEARGVAIVPTAWRDRLRPGDLEAMFEELGRNEVVVKPQLGANAYGAFRLSRDAPEHLRAEIRQFYENRALMAQPFVRAIQTEGEYSLFYFNGEYSHAVLKKPQREDFRSQEEHGARVTAVDVDEALHKAGRRTIEAVGQPLLYARADFVRDSETDGFWLMELELIEPSLYLRMHPQAPHRFAGAIESLMRECQ